MSGVFDPEIWVDGEDPENIPSADDLNAEWRDPLRFFMGIDDISTGTGSRPIYLAYSTQALSLTSAVTEFNMPFNNDRLKRGGIVHSTSSNNHQITVPYTGQYQGFMQLGFTSTSTVATRLIARLKKTPATPVLLARIDDSPQRTGGWAMAGSFTVDLTAGDVVFITVATTAGTAVAETGLLVASKVGLWYSGDYV